MTERKNKLETADDVLLVYNLLRCNGFECEWSGLNVWVTGNLTDKQRMQLQTMGARYAGKREQWYFRASEGLPRHIEGIEEAA